MRPLSRSLSVALLVGYLASAVAIAGEIACDGPYKDHKLTPEELATVLRNHQAWVESDGRLLDDERRANLCRADLQRADLQGADLQWANLRGARLSRARLQNANLYRADLQGALLNTADFQGALLLETNLQNANLYRANLAQAIYEPDSEKLPRLWSLTDPVSKLETLVFRQSPAALIALREAFKKAGMRTQERQLTYAIEHGKRLRAWDPVRYGGFPRDELSWQARLAGKSESLFTYVLFEIPSGYGMAPGRALWGLLGLIPIFAVPYWMATKPANSRRGLWMIVPADRLTRGRGRERIVRIRLQIAKTWRGDLRDEFRLFRTCLYFSLLSAFHLGWRELNVGTWITRMQPREYTLRATGWVRMVSGLQSLLSVYLLALWALTYFSRPFE